MVSDDPPSREAVTISYTCLECELVKIFVNSGMRTAASVPQLMIVASCHQRLSSVRPPTVRSLSNSALIRYDVVIHRIDAIQINRVSGASKLNSFKPRYCFSEIA